MEKWKEIFPGIIPNDEYTVSMINGEETGLIIELKGINNLVVIKFGNVSAVRILDEGIVQEDVYNDEAIDDLKKNKFDNVIYEMIGGKFENYINKISGGYSEILDLKHYVIITLNYNIDIISQWKPEINVKKLKK